MIINLIGPPCAGKSYIASRYVLEHPSWNYLSIDECRITQRDENKAWELFEWWLSSRTLAIAESSGLSWRLPAILKKQVIPVYTIALLAKREELHKRLAVRQHKRKIPYKLRMDEKQSIDWVLQNIGSCEYPIDLVIRTDEMSQEEAYRLVSEKIEEIRLQRAKEKCNVI